MLYKRISLFIILIYSLSACNQEKSLDGLQILNESITAHDSSGTWNRASLNLHIQEPRVSNPYRYSILKLDNSKNTFELSRNRDEYVSKHCIESNGNSFTLLDGKKEIDTSLIKKYRLEPQRNIGYKNFYQLMYGLPMSLNNYMEKIVSTTEVVFNKEQCYKIEVELKEPMISKYWTIYISKTNNRIIGIEIVFPDKPNEGERLYFEGIINIDGIKIPRIRHWHELKNDTYSGSDIVIKELTK
ncbi:DUF6503 family protein [Aureibaculum conchae]|uniref:DUF6503 family protein n=1 Tax=Aureibaculum sp. 2308TA14-22 TaxID=3108392 RepID=UPI003395D48A